ncbi:MAG TPA: threonylcarbamoyl-AMP synthase [Desulfobulbaceae bacterium]|nr:threonylcarbamoyl-AMP synthase [Desulfobulbaceae bacterium]
MDGKKHFNTGSTVSECDIDRAAAVLGKGGLVAFPTESWYGLAVDPFNPEALDRLFFIKQRPLDKPILVLVSGIGQLDSLVRNIPPLYHILMEKFWPGPLTLVFSGQPDLPQQLTAGTATVAVRCSSNPVASALVERFGRPITATSANISGSGAFTTAKGVAAGLRHGVDMILDGGRTPGGRGSTLVTCRGERLLCLREGQIPFSAVQAAAE